MPGLKNCPECGRLFVDNILGLCPDCQRKELEAEEIVAAFLRKTQKASIEEIHEATGVKEKVILRMINRGRIVGDFEITYPCENCGAQITEGRLCISCAKNFVEQVKPVWSENKDDNRKQLRMYTKKQ